MRGTSLEIIHVCTCSFKYFQKSIRTIFTIAPSNKRFPPEAVEEGKQLSYTQYSPSLDLASILYVCTCPTPKSKYRFSIS